MVWIRRENDACNVTLFALFSRLGCNVGVVQIILFGNDDSHISPISQLLRKKRRAFQT